MERETGLAEDIRITEEHVKLDAACKRILSRKIILAWIMKSCLEEYKDSDVQEIAEQYIEGEPQVSEVPVRPDERSGGERIRGTGNEDTSLTEGTITYDIRFFATAPVSGEVLRLIVNVEAQDRFNPGYPLIKRGIYYCSRMISSQYGTEFEESHYEKIRKVSSIWICLTPTAGYRNSITRYHMTEEQLMGESALPARDYDLLNVVMIHLGNPDELEEANVLKLLDVLFSRKINAAEKKEILEKEFSIAMTRTMEEEVSAVCNLSEGIERRGIARGREQGLAEGRAEGRAEGNLHSIKTLMETLGFSVEAAMNALRIPEEERIKYEQMLKQ